MGFFDRINSFFSPFNDYLTHFMVALDSERVSHSASMITSTCPTVFISFNSATLIWFYSPKTTAITKKRSFKKIINLHVITETMKEDCEQRHVKIGKDGNVSF